MSLYNAHFNHLLRVFTMGKVILIHANCHNTTARGDFVFAGNIAKDLVHELHSKSIHNIGVTLVSTLDGVRRFEGLYGAPVKGQITVEKTWVGLSSLEEFDAIEHTVIAFIDANRCKHSSAELIKRVLSPDCKFLFVGNVNQQEYSDLSIQALYRKQIKLDQPSMYDLFSDKDILLGSAGLGKSRLGLPTITKTEDLSELAGTQRDLLPTGDYGFMYVNAVDSSRDFKLIAQYIKLSGLDKYVLVGEFSSKKYEIQHAYDTDTSLFASKKVRPQIEYHQSLPSGVMRKTVADSKSSLVLSTGVTSTLEAMQDGKLTYYQDLSSNIEFVTAYLIAMKSIVSSDRTISGIMPQLIIKLSNLLFASKPLDPLSMEQTNLLIFLSPVRSKLINMNQTIIGQASGTIAPRLLTFIGAERNTSAHVQLAAVCTSLRKVEERVNPVHDRALRRAACWNRLFELKVLIKSMSRSDLDKKDPISGRSALHFAVFNKHLDCARQLVIAGASLDIQDKDGKTPLHGAVSNGDRVMIKMLIEAGVSVDITDNEKHKPQECAPDSSISLFVTHCRDQVISKHGGTSSLGE